MIQPLGDRILIQPEPSTTETESGIQLVEHRKPETMGTVVRVPERIGCECPECGHTIYRVSDVKVGDTVLFSWQSGQEIMIDDSRYLLLRESDLLAVLEGV